MRSLTPIFLAFSMLSGCKTPCDKLAAAADDCAWGHINEATCNDLTENEIICVTNAAENGCNENNLLDCLPDYYYYYDTGYYY
jgi:hypothetical protein